MHLERLALDTQGLSWQLAPGSQATVQYGSDAIVVRDLSSSAATSRSPPMARSAGPATRCSHDDERRPRERRCAAAAAPAVHRPASTRRARCAGTRQAPQGNAEFQVTKGSFRQFQYDTSPARSTTRTGADGRCQAAAEPHAVDHGEGLCAAGALHRSRKRAGTPAPITTPSSLPRIASTSRSTAARSISGSIQGFTTALTDVNGHARSARSRDRIGRRSASDRRRLSIADGVADGRAHRRHATRTSPAGSTCSRIACTSIRSRCSTTTTARCR